MSVTFAEALRSLPKASREMPPLQVVLACGFTPLHISTFLRAHLQQNLGGRAVETVTGLYGDLAGTLENADPTSQSSLAVIIEWRDLDKRLSFRQSGDWGPSATNDIVASATAMLRRIYAALLRRPPGTRAAISLPTLPLPPVFHTAGWDAGASELALNASVAEFASAARRLDNVLVVNERYVCMGAPEARYDLKSDLLFDLPYTMAHAGSLASGLANLIAPPPPKKGIITDLDDTLWHGLVGEVGPDNVSWDLTSHHHIHGLYQQFLSAAAQRGVLIGIASKNDPAVAAKALERPDLLVSPERIFPVEVHWNAKSGSVGRVLKAWNIAADSVVFIDDSPMELAEVAAAHPGIETILFPKNDYAKAYQLLQHLRDTFGKEQLSADDAIRLQSLRAGSAFEDLGPAGAPGAEDFLKQAEARLTIDFETDSSNSRILELVNKTNQFNLNGQRYTAGEWAARLHRPGAFAATVQYEDKFGPLGTIAVISGIPEGSRLSVETWVMSCRAFSRRIEYQCLRQVFDHFGAESIRFQFTGTAKNGPLREFLTVLCGAAPEGPVDLSRARFEQICPPLYHDVTESRRAEANA